MKATFTFMVLTDGKESTLQIWQGTVSKKRTFRPVRHVATETVQGRLNGVHAALNLKYQTAEYPAFERLVTQ